MRVKDVWRIAGFAFVLLLPAWAVAEAPKARPGKGMSLVPGDFAEYTNTEFAGDKKTVRPSTIMVAMGKTGELEGVMVMSVRDGKLVSKRTIFYDLDQAKIERGELLEKGKESLVIDGKKHECTWEKRRDGDVVATFWRSPDLPFETYAKVEMVAKDGRKLVTELILYGPDTTQEKKNQEFLKRLQELNAQSQN